MRRLSIIAAFLTLPFLSAQSQLNEDQPNVENLDSLKEVLIQNDSPEEKIQTLIYIGYHHWWNENYDDAIITAKKALKIAESSKTDSLRISPIKLLSSAYGYNFNDTEFLSSNYSLLTLAKKYGATFAYMEALNDRGVYFLQTENKDSSLYYLTKLNDVSKKHPKNIFTVNTLFNLGYLCRTLDLEERALKYYNEAFKSANEVEDTYTRFYICYELYALYHKKNVPDSAAHYLNLADASRSIYDLKSINFNFLLIQFRTNHLDNNYAACDSLLSEMDKMNLTQNQYFEFAQFQLCKINQEVQKRHYKKALNRISDNETNTLHFFKSVDILEITEIKATCYSELEDYQSALIYSRKVKELTDSLNQPFNLERLLTLQMEYEMDKDISLLRESHEKTTVEVEKKNSQIIASVLSVIILLILLGIAFFMFSAKKTQAKKLEKMVEFRTKEIEKANGELKHKISELTAFNHVTSHDFKQPIRNISAFTSLLAVKKKNLLDDEAKQYLQFLEKSSQQLNNLLSSLEYYNSIESELNKQINLVNSSLNDVLFQAKALIRINKTMKIELLSEAPSIQLQTEPNLLTIVIKNLIENGLKYNTSEVKKIEISHVASAKEHIISVRDNGIGIKPEFQDKIFFMFERLHSKSEYDGTGLGLAICTRLVTALNGKITVKSGLGKGSVFSVHLPNELVSNN